MGKDHTQKLHVLLEAIDQVSNRQEDVPINDLQSSGSMKSEANDFALIPIRSGDTARYRSYAPDLQPSAPEVEEQISSAKTAEHSERKLNRFPQNEIRKTLDRKSDNSKRELRPKKPKRNSRTDRSARKRKLQTAVKGDQIGTMPKPSSDGVTRLCLGDLKCSPNLVFNKHSCSKCGFRFFDKNSLSRHEKSMHEEPDEKWECTDCHAKFRNHSNLLRHAVVHDGKPEMEHRDVNGHTCKVCSAWFNTKRALTNHMQSHDDPQATRPKNRPGRKSGEVSFQCSIEGCGYVNRQRCNAIRHFEIVHLGLKPYVCTEPGCDYKGSTTANLKTHVIRMHKKETLCAKPDKRPKEEFARDSL